MVMYVSKTMDFKQNNTTEKMCSDGIKLIRTTENKIRRGNML